MEPDFDLLVLLELGHQTRIPRAERGTSNVIQHFNVHLRSLETCAPHPDAAKPIIRHSLCSFARTSWSFYFQVVGRYLAVLFLIGVDQQEESQTCQLRVWDWTTGNPVTYVDVVGAESRGFAFLSDNLIAIPRHATSIPNLESTQEKALGTVNIYTFEPPAGTSLILPARHIASLQLPLSPENSASTTRLSCRSDPAPSPSTQAAVWDRRRPRLFELAPTNRVLCLHATVTLLSRAGFIEGYEGTLYIPFENLLNTVADLRDRSQPVNIEWGSWGNGTSWLNTSDMRTNNECYVFGQRTISTTTFAQDDSDEDSSPRTHSFVVLDFDPVRLSKRHNSDLLDPASGNISHFGIEDNLLWEAFLGKNVECKANAPLSVETARIRTRLSSEYYVMIDDEHIVLVLSRLGVESALLVYSL
ncbi:hypothetical protein FRC09_015167 [Ceratobasidium sp. 395]|nr:hypothetical protein FRC09_015167 [Ceratobasidium sp. 395]